MKNNIRKEYETSYLNLLKNNSIEFSDEDDYTISIKTDDGEDKIVYPVSVYGDFVICQSVLNSDEHYKVKIEDLSNIEDVKELTEIVRVYLSNDVNWWNKDFPNGFVSWAETHFEFVSMIVLDYDKNLSNNVISNIIEMQGRGGLYELAEDMTDNFEEKFKDFEWDGEFFDEIENFYFEYLKKLKTYTTTKNNTISKL